ncbi:MAG: glycoside hydrolase family 18 protein [Sphingobacteriales bacterium]
MKKIFPVLSFLLFSLFGESQKTADSPMNIIGYYAGSTTALDSFPLSKLNYLIFSFCHLKGNRLSVTNAKDTATIQKMVSLKQNIPGLKIILSLGGWGGCKDCSPVFSTKKGRKEFAASTRELMEYFQADGIDLDWEYPVIAGFPGHPYSIDDKQNFTSLIKLLRRKLGTTYKISFAAGGFGNFIDSAIEWKKVMRRADRVNLMSYDLVHGFSTVSGHHTPLYSTSQQVESADNGVNKLLSSGVPSKKNYNRSCFLCPFF